MKFIGNSLSNTRTLSLHVAAWNFLSAKNEERQYFAIT